MTTIIEQSEFAEGAAVEGLTYEQAFTELEATVAALETHTSTLDEALALFDRGQALARYCARLLDQAEMKVKRISGEDLVDFIPSS
jgi:exodeoxyribonuclease VII small subunit